MTADPGTANADAGGPPPLALFFLEGQRALLEGLTLPAAAPFLRRAPRGEGQPVLLLPGFTAGDGSMRTLRRYLARRGFRSHPWLQGRNLGPRARMIERVSRRLVELYERYDAPVSLVGWSLGGVYARELAKGFPEQVRQVITLGSPFADIGRPSNVSRWYDRNGEGGEERAGWIDRLREPPTVPSTAIYSKTDGVVHWETCREPERPHTESIEVPGSHCGLGVNPLVLYLVAERLAQPVGEWRPFAYEGWRRLAFG